MNTSPIRNKKIMQILKIMSLSTINNILLIV